MHKHILCVYSCELQRCGLARAVRTGNKRSGPDSNSCSLRIQYTGDSKTDSWDN